MTLFYSFHKNYSTSATMLSTIIIFKRCKFNVNLWILCLCYKKYPNPLRLIFSNLLIEPHDLLALCAFEWSSRYCAQYHFSVVILWCALDNGCGVTLGHYMYKGKMLTAYWLIAPSCCLTWD